MDDIFEMHLQSDIFKLVATGEKTFEIRVNDLKRQKIKVGNIVTFIDREDQTKKVSCKVENLFYFKTFVELFHNIKKEDCGFSPKLTADQIEDFCLQFFSAEEIHKYGLVVLQIKKVKI